MAKRKYRTEVVKHVTLEFRFDSLADGVLSDRQLRAMLDEAWDGFEP